MQPLRVGGLVAYGFRQHRGAAFNSTDYLLHAFKLVTVRGHVLPEPDSDGVQTC